MEYTFTKAKLPKGWSYPLKRGVLDAALESNGITQVSAVYYSDGKYRHDDERALVLSAYLHLRSATWPYDDGMVHITLCAVSSQERKATEGVIVSDVLPMLIDWLRSFEGPESSRGQVRQTFEAKPVGEGWSIEAT